MWVRALLVGLLLGSGAAGLTLQTVWMRELRAVLGASTPSTAAVLAIFLGGLGLGGALLGRRVERSPRPLRTYGLLELGVALSAAISPFLIDAAHRIYLASGGSTGLGGGATFVRLALAVVVLGTPAVLM